MEGEAQLHQGVNDLRLLAPGLAVVLLGLFRRKAKGTAKSSSPRLSVTCTTQLRQSSSPRAVVSDLATLAAWPRAACRSPTAAPRRSTSIPCE
jgi:hypothetical protein